MGNIYTLSELSELLSVTRPIVEKRLERIDNKPPNNTPIKWTVKNLNNREIKAVELSREQEHAIGLNNDVNTQNSECNTHSEPYIKQPEKHSYNDKELIDRILEYSDKYNTRIESYIERAANAEQQVKLITVSEANKDAEINRLNALVKEYETRIKLLKTELENERKKPFWRRNII